MLPVGIGLFRVTAYAISRRTTEIGVRMALGAMSQIARRPVLRDSALVAFSRALIGVGLAVAATRVIRSNFYCLRAMESLTMAAATVALTAIDALAGFLPAQPAGRIDPLAAPLHE